MGNNLLTQQSNCSLCLFSHALSLLMSRLMDTWDRRMRWTPNLTEDASACRNLEETIPLWLSLLGCPDIFGRHDPLVHYVQFTMQIDEQHLHLAPALNSSSGRNNSALAIPKRISRTWRTSSLALGLRTGFDFCPKDSHPTCYAWCGLILLPILHFKGVPVKCTMTWNDWGSVWMLAW